MRNRLGNRSNQIQHTWIVWNRLVPNFNLKMLLKVYTGVFFQNGSSQRIFMGRNCTPRVRCSTTAWVDLIEWLCVSKSYGPHRYNTWKQIFSSIIFHILFHLFLFWFLEESKVERFDSHRSILDFQENLAKKSVTMHAFLFCTA